MSDAVGMIGVGRMGLPMAKALIESGRTVYGTRRGHAEELVALGGVIPGEGLPRDVAHEADVVICCLPGPAEIAQVISGPGGLVEAGRPLTVVEMSTCEVDYKLSLCEALRTTGSEMLDCPISGTPVMLAAGLAMVFASGDEAAFERVRPVLSTFAPKTAYVGEFGSGTAFKFFANTLVAVHAAVAAEVMAMAERSGVDTHRVVELISASQGAMSGQFNARAPFMASRDFPTHLGTVDMLRKDLDVIARFVSESGARAPLFLAARDLYDEFSAQGEGDADPSKLVMMLSGR